jgi:hypothetical protein
MATALKLRRGTTAQHASFTGAEGEVTVDTTKDTVVVHDGSTAGGFPLAKETGSTVAVAAGAVGTPGLTVSGDTNTGIFFPAADTIAFAEGGAEAMRITSDGAVAIGNTSALVTAAGRGNLTINGSSSAILVFGVAGVSQGYIFNNGTDLTTLNDNVGSIIWETNGAERMRIDSSGNVGIGTSSPTQRLDVVAANSQIHFGAATTGGGYLMSTADGQFRISGGAVYNGSNWIAKATTASIIGDDATGDIKFFTNTSLTSGNSFTPSERMRIDSSGNVFVGGTNNLDSNKFNIIGAKTLNAGIPQAQLAVGDTTSLATGTGGGIAFLAKYNANDLTTMGSVEGVRENGTSGNYAGALVFKTRANGGNNNERARITSGGDFLVGKTSDTGNGAGITLGPSGYVRAVRSNELGLLINRLSSDGTLVSFEQDTVAEGSISVSGNTVSYNAFCGGHWTQLQEGRGYNPDIPRGTVMSSIGEMSEWKSVTWTETVEHPAIPSVEAKEAVLDEEGNVVEPAVEAVEGKDAWTESFDKRDTYLGNLPIGATFEEDGVTKTVVDDGNERLPKVKISDVVGDKAVYGVFQTWDEAQDMLVSSLGAFVVRIAAGVTVQIGDLLESNGDGCAKVQDDDVIRSKTIGKVTSTVATATYADGSYTVPCVLYCG